MNQPDKSKSSRRTLLWALLAVFMLGSIGIAVVGFALLKRSGISMTSFAGGSITPIDLTPYYDKPSASWTSGSEWRDTPRGPVVLGGVPFELNGLLRLTGRSAKNDNKGYREEVKGIAVNRKFARLHVLHIVSYNTSQESPYARITLRYADDSTTSWLMTYGQHGRDWHRPKHEYPSALGDPNSKVVWRGEYSNGRTLRLFKTTFTNPKPELEVTAIDLSSENASPNATILSMSTGPANLPRPKDDAASLPEPEEIYDGEMKFIAVDAQDGKPVANVTLKISGTETGGSFRTPDVVTDAKGECIVKHPGGSTRSLTVAASGDGIAMKTIRWGQNGGEPIPNEYTFRAEKAATIGSVVLDESGQPVRNVKISISALTRPSGDQAQYNQLPFTQTTLTSDDQGRWSFRSLPQNFGSFNMVVSHPDYVDARYLSDGADRAYVGERVKLATLLKTDAIFKLRKGLVVTGRVLTDEGKPISGAKLLLGSSRFVNTPNQTKTDERGEFRLPGAEAGSTYLTVQAAGRSPESRQIIVDAKLQPIEFKLGPGHIFKAKVIDEFGTPVRTARITVDMWQNRQTLDLTGSTDTRGKVTINSMPESGMSGSIYKAGYMNMNGIAFVVDGEDQTFTLRKTATITGTVVDADTKASIERFDVMRGQASGGDQIYWQTYNITKGANGGFSFKLDQQNITALQIDADDHLPTTVLLGTNGQTHFDVELKKGSGPKGIVQTPDGQPAEGAQVAVLIRGKMLSVGANRLTTYGDSESRVVTANAKGDFSLRFYANGDKIIAVHPQGYAETAFSNFVSGGTIKLERWGAIEGTLKIGQQPGTNESVLLLSDGGIQFNFADSRATTDERGMFSMTNVPPGERRLVRLIPIGDRSWGHSHMQNVIDDCNDGREWTNRNRQSNGERSITHD